MERTTFSIGKGLYVEARTKMMNVSQISSNGWPSFWFDDMRREALTGLEGIEPDIMEYSPQLKEPHYACLTLFGTDERITAAQTDRTSLRTDATAMVNSGRKERFATQGFAS